MDDGRGVRPGAAWRTAVDWRSGLGQPPVDARCPERSNDFPKVVVIDPRLIVRLEQLADALEAIDKPAELHIMSGYRTPFYNRAIENVRYSLHQWGAAADVFVDDDKDGRM